MQKTEKKDIKTKAFFFLRHNNDIDHITPVLYKWLSTENIPTDIIIMNNRKFLHDYRIEFLKKYKNANIYFFRDLFKKYSVINLFYIFYSKYTTELDNLFTKNRMIRGVANRFIKGVTNKLFKGIDKAIVVFDWTTTYFSKKIVKIAKNRKFSTISLPHGDWPYLNYLITKEGLNYSFLDSFKPLDIFDYIVVANHSMFKRYKIIFNKEKIIILGSSRYCDEWIDINSKLIPTYNVEESKDKLKIVFFMRNEDFPIFWEEVVRTIKLILQFPNIYLIIKHHPRNRIAKKVTKKLLNLYPELKKKIDKNLKFIYTSVNSSSLIKWADLIMDIGTSTTWESIKQKKPVLMPEYLHANISMVAHYIKASEIKCRDELYGKIQIFIKDKDLKFYNENERRKFINEIIDVPDKNVLERYVNFLKKCLNE